MSNAISTAALSFRAARGVSAPSHSHTTLWITVLALIALQLKLIIAFNTFGSNDVVTFYTFARSLSDHGLEWTYRNGVVFVPSSPIFNHPPLTAYYLGLIDSLSRLDVFRSYGLTFPFLLRLPGIIADFVVVLVLMRLSASNPRFRIPTWALALFAVSPVSLMVSGFHGNTDPIMVMFLVLACLMCVTNRPLLCGLFLALSAQVKIVPLLIFPVFFLFWFSRHKMFSFLVPFVLTSCALSWEPLVKFPVLFLNNLFSYGSTWGIWGITYWLRLTGHPDLGAVTFYQCPPLESLISMLLKLVIIAAVFVIAWRRRQLDGLGLIHSVAYIWIIFFVFSPGIGAQYMVWLAPFVLVLWPGLYGYLAASSSLFLFFFYNITAGGLPWYVAISTNKLNLAWTPWSLWPWAVLIVGLICLCRKAAGLDPLFRVFSLQTLPSKAQQ